MLLLSIIFNVYQANKLRIASRDVYEIDSYFVVSLSKLGGILEDPYSDQPDAIIEHANTARALSQFTSFSKGDKAGLVNSYSGVTAQVMRDYIFLNRKLENKVEVGRLLKELGKNPLDDEKGNQLISLIRESPK